MEGSSQAAVTPQGVRDGDPAVLATLVARRGPAVLAFCDAVCEADTAPHAAAEAFARFRALVSAVGDEVGSADPEAFLLGATRHAAASMARIPVEGRSVLRAIGRGASTDTYAQVPALLAARADSMLGPEDLERLSRLLERSSACRDVEAAFRRAERGYKSPPVRPLDPEFAGLVIDAMRAAAPLADAFAVAEPPAAAAPAPPSAWTATPTEPAFPEPAETPSTDPEPALTGAVDPVEAVGPVEPVPAAGAQPPTDEEAWPAEDVTVAEVPRWRRGAAAPAPEPAVEEAPAFDDAEPWEEEPDWDPVAPADAPLPVAHGSDDLAADAPPRVYRARRRMPRVALPDGGGLRLPRSRSAGSPAADAPVAEHADVDHGPVYRLLLPALAVFIAVLVMLAIAGVFGGGDPAPAATVRPGIVRQVDPDAATRTATAAAATTTARTSTPASKPKAKTRRHRSASKRRATSRRHRTRAKAPARAARTSTRSVASAPPVSAPVVRPIPAPAPAPARTSTRKPTRTTSTSSDDDYQPYDPSRQPDY